MKVILKVNQVIKSLLLNKKIKDSKGFTLIEILLVAMLMFVVISMISATYFLAINTSKDTIDTTTSGRDARLAAYRITKDLRETIDLSIAKNDEIEFKSDVDSDGDYEIVNYSLVSEDGHYTIYRKIDTEDAKIVATKIVKNDLFTYYSDINTPEGGLVTPVGSSELNEIKIIEIYIHIDQSGVESPRTMKLETSVSLRNKM